MSSEATSAEENAVAAARRIEFRKFGAKKTNGAKLVPLVDGMIFTNSICALIGPANSMKTFIARDICASVASGAPCYSRSVFKGAVFFLLGEGNSQMELRLRAYEKGHKVRLKNAELRHSSGVCSFAHDSAVKALSDRIDQIAKKTEIKPALIVIDPLSKVMIGLDENSAENMTAFIASIDEHFRSRFGCTVLLVHHSGHSGNRARGSSALGAAVETSMFVKRDGARVTITCTKQKDADNFVPIHLKAEAITLGARYEGDQIVGESIVLRVADGPQNSVSARALGVLEKLSHGKSLQWVKGVAWKEALVRAEIIKSSKAFDKLRKRLSDNGKIERRDRDVRLSGG